MSPDSFIASDVHHRGWTLHEECFPTEPSSDSRENEMSIARAFASVAAGLMVIPIGACASGDASKRMAITQTTAPPNMVFEVRGVV